MLMLAQIRVGCKNQQLRSIDAEQIQRYIMRAVELMVQNQPLVWTVHVASRAPFVRLVEGGRERRAHRVRLG